MGCISFRGGLAPVSNVYLLSIAIDMFHEYGLMPLSGELLVINAYVNNPTPRAYSTNFYQQEDINLLLLCTYNVQSLLSRTPHLHSYTAASCLANCLAKASILSATLLNSSFCSPATSTPAAAGSSSWLLQWISKVLKSTFTSCP